MIDLDEVSTFLKSIPVRIRQELMPLLWVGALYRALGVVIFLPVLGFLHAWFLARTGRTALVDQDIVAFLLEPIGALGTLLVLSLFITFVALEQSSLLLIVSGTRRSESPLPSLRLARANAGPVFGLVGRLLIRLLGVAAPFAAAIGLTYLLLLTEYDINYYLAERPPEYYLALAIAVAIGAGLVGALLWLASRVSLALPILLFEGLSPREAISESAKRSQHSMRPIASLLLAVAIASGLLGFLLGIPAWLLGRVLIPAFMSNPDILVLLIGLLLLTLLAGQLLASFLASAVFSMAVADLYKPQSNASRMSPETREDTATGKLTLRRLGFAAAGLSAAAVLVGIWFLQSADTPDRSDITAHRGASGRAPENTLAAFEIAIRDKADWIELDVQRTADGRVVVIHDQDLRRVGGSGLVIAKTSYAELTAVDIGSWFDASFADQRLPLLQNVLRLCRDRIAVNIELKYYGWDQNLAPAVIALVEKSNMQQQIALMSLNSKAVMQAKELRPEWQVGQLTAVSLGDLTQLQADFLAVHSANASMGFVRRAHASGKGVQVWTVNDSAGMHAMFGLGVDALITDYPGRAVAIRKQRAEMSSTQRMLVRTGLMLFDDSEFGDPELDAVITN